MKVVFVDNFDSFTYNLVEYVSDQRLDDGSAPETVVVKNTASLDAIRQEQPDAIVISPGPGHPKNDRDIGVTSAVLRELSSEIPTLGVCLGMEAMVHEFGGRVGTAPSPVHGKSSPVSHDGTGLFSGVDDGFPAGRYHSLSAVDVRSPLEVTATTDHDGTAIPMAVRHRSAPIVGVQFHPESVLTGAGHDIVGNFLEMVS